MKNIKKAITLITIMLIALSSTLTVHAMTSQTKYQYYAEKLNQLGIFKGTDSGFELDRVPTRVEAAVMFVRLLGAEEYALYSNYEHPFTDVLGWADPYIGYLYHEKLTYGTSSTIFSSDDAMSAEGYIAFILRALNYSDTSGDFTWDNVLDFALNQQLISDKDYAELNTDEFLRDHMVKYSYMALNMPMKNSNKLLAEWLVDSFTMDNQVLNSVVLTDVVKGIIDKIIKPDMSEFEKIKVISDYIHDNYEYDYTFTSNSVYGMIMNGKGVCQAFAETLDLFTTYIGIESKLVSGNIIGEGPHAWNIVKIDGNYYHIDCTWNETGSRYAYFLLSDNEIKKSHIWNQKYYPECKTDNGISHNKVKYIDSEYMYFSDWDLGFDKDIGRNLYKVKYDGSSEIIKVVTLPEDSSLTFHMWQIEDGWCYYAARSNLININRVNLVTNEIQEIVKDYPMELSNMVVFNKEIFVIDPDGIEVPGEQCLVSVYSVARYNINSGKMDILFKEKTEEEARKCLEEYSETKVFSLFD